MGDEGMYKRCKLNKIEDYFLPRQQRSGEGVYFGRLDVYNPQIQGQLEQFVTSTMQLGVCVEGKIGNPEEKQLDYYEEIMGRSYELRKSFFQQELKQWLPRVSEDKRSILANSFYDLFSNLARRGKNENMQRNAYIKYMCWLYYKFERLLAKQQGNALIPKILYQGYPNEYELMFLDILSMAGCDILILLTNGDTDYQKVDSALQYSEKIVVEGSDFPTGFSILHIQQQLIQKQRIPKTPEIKTEKTINTNTWLTGDVFEDLKKLPKERGTENAFFYNAFVGIYGVENSSSYYSKLLKWKLRLENDTAVYLFEEGIPKPSFDEISAIQRKNYENANQLMNHMVTQIVSTDKKAESYGKAAYLRVFQKETEISMQKLLNYSVEVISLCNRYLADMYQNVGNSRKEKILFLFYGEIKSQTERLFLEVMAGLPLDVVIINPEGQAGLEIKNSLFFVKNYENTLPREKFPTDIKDMNFGTVAYQAERELDQMMYQDTGMYRNQQFTRAVPVVLSNTYDEVGILWEQEAKYRPNFEIFDDRVIVPVIFAKVSGVSNGDVSAYWESVAKLTGEDVFIIKSLPYLNPGANPWRDRVYQFLSGTTLLKNEIKASPQYPFGFIREVMQDYMLEKLQELLTSNLIEVSAGEDIQPLMVAVILNMDKELVRQIQKYDFTKKIPKVLIIHTKESNASKEDAILMAYLSLVGFDIAMYVPTGYNCVERYYTRPLVREYQIGEYKYDLKIPKLSSIKRSSESFMGRIFKRGR